MVNYRSRKVMRGGNGTGCYVWNSKMRAYVNPELKCRTASSWKRPLGTNCCKAKTEGECENIDKGDPARGSFGCTWWVDRYRNERERAERERRREEGREALLNPYRAAYKGGRGRRRRTRRSRRTRRR